jgi:hypothetical protein
MIGDVFSSCGVCMACIKILNLKNLKFSFTLSIEVNNRVKVNVLEHFSLCV